MPLSDTALETLKEWRSQVPGCTARALRVSYRELWPDRQEGDVWWQGRAVRDVSRSTYRMLEDSLAVSQENSRRRVSLARHATHRRFRVAAGGATDGTLQAIFGWMSARR